MSAARTSPGAADRGLRPVVLALALLAGCRLFSSRSIPDSESRYDVLSPASMRRFEMARRLQDEGRIAEARDALAELAREHPDNVPVGIWLQEAEIAVAAPDAGPGAGLPEDVRELYRKRAAEDPRVANLVLAARLEPDPEAASALLDAAENADRSCAWPPYARAWLAARAGEWSEVRAQVGRALAADPGHLPARWLEAWMLTRGGSPAEAIPAVDAWIEKARGDPRIDARLVREAELDRAILAVLDADPRGARKRLAELADPGLDPGRLQMITAAAEQDASRARAALAAAEAAESLRPGEILPVVQQALLHEFWLGDPPAARVAWTRVLALSRSSPGLGDLLERLRARVRLERLQAAPGALAPGADESAPGTDASAPDTGASAPGAGALAPGGRGT